MQRLKSCQGGGVTLLPNQLTERGPHITQVRHGGASAGGGGGGGDRRRGEAAEARGVQRGPRNTRGMGASREWIFNR